METLKELNDRMMALVASLSLEEIKAILSDESKPFPGEEYLRGALMEEWERRDAAGFESWIMSR